jgi:hypothetical protein
MAEKSFTEAEILRDRDLALDPAPVRVQPGASYAPSTRDFQGIPGIARTPEGTLWATWYAGGPGEGPENYALLVRSEDDGHTWSELLLVIDPPGLVRAFDPVVWCDPLGRLWWFWAQSYTKFDGRAGVWFIRCDNPSGAPLSWSAPRRLWHGVMMNKPTVLRDHTWLLPIALWNAVGPETGELARYRRSNVFASTDQGVTWRWRGGADVPERTYDEHVVVERADGTLWMLVRTRYGIGQSFSADGGRTWSQGEPAGLGGPNSRFHIRRLRSGELLLINHATSTSRSLLTAYRSMDEGKTWEGGLLLDPRQQVSYPDATEDEQGRIYAIYDRERHGAREILMAVFRPADVIAGELVSEDSRLRQVVNRASQVEA